MQKPNSHQGIPQRGRAACGEQVDEDVAVRRILLQPAPRAGTHASRYKELNKRVWFAYKPPKRFYSNPKNRSNASGA